MKRRTDKKSISENPLASSYRFLYACTVLLAVALLFNVFVANVSAATGLIDPFDSGHYKALIQNPLLGSHNTLNFGKFTTESAKNITVSDTELRGYAWGEGVGWVVMNCADTTSGCSGANGNFKVANDGGDLSGYAWGEHTGWINFGPFTEPAISTVKIEDGLFGGTLGDAGYAWSQNFGWIKFDCSSDASCVETNWGMDSEGGGGGGGGGGDNPPNDICPNIAGVQHLIPSGLVIDANGNCVSPQQCDAINGALKQPLDVIVIVDRSGSMAGTKITQAKTAATGFVDHLLSGSDRVGAVSFSDSATLLTGLSSTYANTKTKIQAIAVGGNTNIGAALKVAYQAIAADGRIGVKHVVILLTDGDATASDFANITPDQYALNQATVAKVGGAILYSIGLGTDVNPNLLRSIASEPANYFYSPTGTDLGDIYLEIAAIACTAVPANISGVVTHDVNGNGAIDSGDDGLGGSQLYLISKNNSQPTRTVTSAADGTFRFDTVTTGDYSLCNTPPLGMTQTLPADGACYDISATQGVDTTGVSFLATGTVPPPTDVCPNVDGNQGTVPDGMTLNTAGDCVLVSVPDACPNIAGMQDGVLNGYIYDLEGNCVPISGNTTDICPNIAGNQSTVPDGMTLNTAGNCVQVSQPDACPNISGVQSNVPNGYIYDLSGNCVPIGSTIDVCPNIAGDQSSVPAGMTLNIAGDCVTVSQPDACPNIAGVQTEVPSGYVYDLSGNCIPVTTPPTDICPNIAGDQSTVPDGMTLNTAGTA